VPISLLVVVLAVVIGEELLVLAVVLAGHADKRSSSRASAWQGATTRLST
jgi:hypothetical protein